VIRVGAPPEGLTLQSDDAPSLPAENTIVAPSGIQHGLVSDPTALVRRVGAEPSAFIV
jgi:hypothetical protein